MCLLPFFTIITYNRGVDIKLRDLITDYIRNNPAIKAAARRDSGIIKADSLDFYPLSRAVKLIAAKRGGRLFAISPTDESARQLFQDLSADDDIPVILLPTDGRRLYSEYKLTSSSYDQKKALDAINEMKGGIVITSLRSFVSPVMSPASLDKFSIKLRIHDNFNPSDLAVELEKAGYYRTSSCYEAGSYSIRGEVMDIFPFSFDSPIRLYAEWDEIGRIAYYDPMTQKSVEELKRVNIPLISGDSSPLFSTLESYLKADDYFLFAGMERIVTAWKAMQNEARSLFNEAYKKDEKAPLPDRILFPWDSFISSVSHCFSVYDISSPEYSHFGISASRSYFGNVTYFKEDIATLLSNGWKISVIAPTDVQKERLENVLRDFAVSIETADISSGFQIEGQSILVVLDNEIFGRRKKRAKSVVETISSPLDSFVELKEGDYVVHVNYGIGRFVKIDRVKTSRTERDYIKIEYANEEHLYVPIEQADLVQKYIGNDGKAPKLDSLGSQSWSKKKEKALKNAQELAAELVHLYAERQSIHGFPFSRDNDWQIQFEASFPFTETPDQLKCIDEIKKDMESDKVMDRLVCGDVGYGKTEIAFRAAFKAVMSGKQVAFLAPTVILAEQHYNNFKARLGSFPVNAGMLSRFVKGSEQKKVLQGVKDGSVDVLFGTHRILQKSISFHDLGLLIVDEEQRFGVKDKERIKQMKTNVDSLTLSATPIPRTLYMSLLKVRDMSLLTTAPRERQPIETEIARFSIKTVSDAIKRELERGGQVFYLHNRIEDLESIVQMIRSEIPYAIVEYAHGQMEADEIEDIMHRFVFEGIQVLVSTTIIENGIDIPNVNTIIIDQADRFGLSQLYQLRGRVGRSDKQAYCYLLYQDESMLNNDAVRRLRVLSENTALGSGFKVAMKDMEIRGAGNILGREQSGHLEAVGLDMYMRLLEEEVDRLMDTKKTESRDVLLELDYSGFIPDTYITDPSSKFEAYKKIASISTEGQLEGLRAELENRYGQMPEEVDNLFCIAEIKIICRRLSIFHLTERRGAVDIEFSQLSALNPDKVINLLKLSGGKVQIDSSNMTHMKMQTGAVSLKDKALFILEQLRRLI